MHAFVAGYTAAHRDDGTGHAGQLAWTVIGMAMVAGIGCELRPVTRRQPQVLFSDGGRSLLGSAATPIGRSENDMQPVHGLVPASRTGSPSTAVPVLPAACGAPHDAAGEAPGERVDTYGSLAICLADANGRHFAAWIAELRRQHAVAEATGRATESMALAKRPIAQQDCRHRQAFDGGDVDDLLLVVEDALPGRCAAAGVARLERVDADRPVDAVMIAAGARLVDHHEPSGQGRMWSAELRKRPVRR